MIRRAFISMRYLVLMALFLAVAPGASLCFAENMNSHKLDNAKQIMIERHLKGRDIKDPTVLDAMKSVKREKFVDPRYVDSAYADKPLPIGAGQTISQPYIVALMTQTLELKKTDKVLEVGTGSGYQAAVLARIVAKVYTIEIITSLAKSAVKLLEDLGYDNIRLKQGDGYAGWPEHAPFDKIIVTAAASRVPLPLEQQLKEGGMLIMPVGGSNVQELLLGVKRDSKMEYKIITMVRFVPMTGAVEE